MGLRRQSRTILMQILLYFHEKTTLKVNIKCTWQSLTLPAGRQNRREWS